MPGTTTDNDKANKARRKDILRFLDIFARGAHLASMATLFGGIMFAVPFSKMGMIPLLTILTGLVLVVLEWLRDRNWPHRAKGLLVMLHVLLAGLSHRFPDYAQSLLSAALFTGAIGSHMLRKHRHWSILHGPEQR